ncbi:MAG: porin [Chloroherpetonaceae bacterium]|nr:porin [Chloroherpetonaceae bacterium]
MNRFLIFCFVFLQFGTFVEVLHAQNPDKAEITPIIKDFGKGITYINSDSTLSTSFRFRTQLRGNFLYDDDELQIDGLFRRFRFRLDGFLLSPQFTYAFQFHLADADFGSQFTTTHGSNRTVIRDANFSYLFENGIQLTFGQGKLPAHRQRIISSGRLQFTDRSIAHSIFDIDRDFGIWFRHQTLLSESFYIREIFCFSGGEGRNQPIDSRGFSYTARLEFLPLGLFASGGDYFEGDLLRENAPKISIAFVYSFNHQAVRSGGQVGFLINSPSDIHTLISDFLFKWQGFSFDGALFLRQRSPSALFTPSAFVFAGYGAHLQSGYFFLDFWEGSVRYSFVTPNQDTRLYSPIQSEYSICLSRYIAGHSIKVQSEFTLIRRRSETQNQVQNLSTFRIQMEVGI